LRQPLHARGLLAAALSSKVREPEVRDIVGSISLSVEALERLFSALMDISKLDAGVVAPARTTFALSPLFARVERQFAPLASSRGLRLTVVPTSIWIDSDPVLLERILANLVGNALNYTEHGGAVVGVRRRTGRRWIDVVDSGVGIAPADRERIFDEFYRVGVTRAAGQQGIGLGLAIVRRLARLLPVRVFFDARAGFALFGGGTACGRNIRYGHVASRSASDGVEPIVWGTDRGHRRRARGARRHAHLSDAVGRDGRPRNVIRGNRRRVGARRGVSRSDHRRLPPRRGRTRDDGYRAIAR
jgi:hypothetical protein